MQHVTAASLTVYGPCSSVGEPCGYLFYGEHFETDHFAGNYVVGFAWGGWDTCAYVLGYYLQKHEGHPPSPAC